MSKHALIIGASVAGPTAAYWLGKKGWKVTVIEKSKDLRLGGQNIDITDAARDVVAKMQVTDKIKENHTGEKGLQFVDQDNKARANFPTEKEGSLTREIEILRGDLVKILVDACPENVSFQFGTTVKSLTEEKDGVVVELSDDSKNTYDVVIAADGMNSSNRKRIIGDGDYEDYLGCWSSYFTVPRRERDNDWWRWYTSPTGVIAFLRPDNKGTMRASVNFLSDISDPEYMSLEEKKTKLRERMKNAGWECDRLADALEQVDDIFLGPLHQIKSSKWFKGRCALVGDSAYCPTPYTGMGTTLAIIGAYILANELAEHERPEDAFKNYEEKFRTFAESSQKLPPGVPDLAYAESSFKVSLINLGAAIGASKPVQAIISFFSGDKNEKQNSFKLPEYT